MVNEFKNKNLEKEYPVIWVDAVYEKVCINKRKHYEGYKKNPNDKIYMMMNKKDIEAYEKAFEEVEMFLKQFPHLKAEILKGIRKGNGSYLFKKLNQHSKNLLAEQTKLA